MSTLEVNTINPQSGSTLTLGSSGNTVTLGSGVSGSGFGKIGQVVSTTKTDSFSSTSTSFTDITGLSVSITPTSTSSKILVLVNTNASSINATYSGVMRIVRDSTAIGIGTNGSATYIGFNALRRNSGSDESKSVNYNFLDSPSSTSSLTYKVQIDVQGYTFYVNRTQTNNEFSGASTITVMEVLA